jgi:hypothetical protein
MTKPPPDIRRKEAARHPDYQRLYRRIVRLEGHLEDTISHFYNIINVLRERVSMLENERVSMLEKKPKPEDKQTNSNHRRGS